MSLRWLLVWLIACTYLKAYTQPVELTTNNIIWHSPSKNSGESMPCGGGDIGLNVWVEHGDLYFYISRSGTFDENNTLLKLGRVKVRLSPNPFTTGSFSQELALSEGAVNITGKSGDIAVQAKLWVDVHRPVIHVAFKSSKPTIAEAAFESWRFKDRESHGKENNQGSWKWDRDVNVVTLKDNISFYNNAVEFYHKNTDSTVFDATVKEQGLTEVRSQLNNPLYHLVFGGMMMGKGLIPSGTYSGKYQNTDFTGWKLQSKKAHKKQSIEIYLNTVYAESAEQWRQKLDSNVSEAIRHQNTAFKNTQDWWKAFWERSYIFINTNSALADSTAWQAGRNYQLFRYMLGCNAYGAYPTKFNGGLFTYDPSFVDSTTKFTPDFRNWGGGLMTAQNQRLVYWPMLKSGDFDMMNSQLDYYLHLLHNAELRTKVYWGHNGACFTEQLENFGLPNLAEYGLKRPLNFDKGVEYNAWLEYTWDTVLEFCQMMLEKEKYNNTNVSTYIPFIESCLTFFDEHYQYLAKQRGIKPLDSDGHLVLYPGSAGETYKMSYNSTSTIVALKTIITSLLALPKNYLTAEERIKWVGMLYRLPPINYTTFNNHRTIAPAKSWERVNNVEAMQLYPVFPWGMYGVGKPSIETAINTWKYDTLAIKFRSGTGWKQDNIFAARLGLTTEAAELTLFKLKNSKRRFPAFWGPGFDWAPDHNWGGTGMIGLQEMLLQAVDRKIYLFPAWPKLWNVHFKLHAPYQTTVEARVENGHITYLNVLPKEREKDIILLLK